jgi:beta-lactamase class A
METVQSRKTTTPAELRCGEKMAIRLSRRKALITAVTLAACGPAFAASSTGTQIADLERQHGGRLGVYVVQIGSGRTLKYRADERFMLDSTFKGPLAAFVLSRVDTGAEHLDAEVLYSADDLLPASPVTSAHVAEGRLSVKALCAAILQTSDNTAANLLMRRVGGPAALPAFLRRIGDAVTRVDRYEIASDKPSGTMDTTTPRAITNSAQAVLLGDVLTHESQAKLRRWMSENRVGHNRLRASFPAPWIVADRTGTSDGYCNELAMAIAPGWAPLMMAAYYEAPGMTVPDQEAVLREIGAVILNWSGSDNSN